MNSLAIKGFKYFLACFGLLLLMCNAMAETYPNKPIRLIVPFPPGGPTDIVARPLDVLLGDLLKEQIIIENKGGAGG